MIEMQREAVIALGTACPVSDRPVESAYDDVGVGSRQPAEVQFWFRCYRTP